MEQPQKITHKFVEFAPEELEAGILYISIPYTTAVHKCCCGCGFEVVTPLSPSGWTLVFDGKTVSLDPSIGNWGFRCQSHYWITRNQVCWAEKWSVRRIGAAQRSRSSESTKDDIKDFTNKSNMPQPDVLSPTRQKEGVWKKIRRSFKGK